MVPGLASVIPLAAAFFCPGLAGEHARLLTTVVAMPKQCAMTGANDKGKQQDEARKARLKKALRANLARRKAANAGPGDDQNMKRRETGLRGSRDPRPGEADG